MQRMLLKAGKRGLNLAVIRCLRDLYSRPSIRLKLPTDKGMSTISRRQLIPVKKGASQGAITSPNLLNNYVLEAQDLCPLSLILSFVNLSLIKYADDILSLSRTLQRTTEIFGILEVEYQKNGREFNSFKSDIVLINWKRNSPAPSVTLGSSSSAYRSPYIFRSAHCFFYPTHPKTSS